MDAFEQLIMEVLWSQGWWAQTNFKFKLRPETKKALKIESHPRVDIDVLAYKARENLIRVVECKSYIFSAGVQACEVEGRKGDQRRDRYRMFTNKEYANAVASDLVSHLLALDMCRESPTVELVLFAGRVKAKDRPLLQRHFREQSQDLEKRGGLIKRWEILDDQDLKRALKKMAAGGYQNRAGVMLARMFRNELRVTEPEPKRPKMQKS